MIQNLIFRIFYENVISGIQRFYICRDVPVDISEFFLIPDFLEESLKANLN